MGVVPNQKGFSGVAAQSALAGPDASPLQALD